MRIQRGDPEAEEDFVRLYSGRVRGMVAARVYDREAVLEIVDDVLMAVLQAIRRQALRDAHRLSAFVYATARNLINNHIRSRLRTPPTSAIESDLTGPDPVESLERRDRMRKLARILAGLDGRDRTILSLALVGGLGAAEIATRLGMTTEQVRQRKSRAVKRVTLRLRRPSTS